MESHLKHHFKKVADKDICQICGLVRENIYNSLYYQRNAIDYAGMEPKCINLEILNKVFENLEF